MRVVVKNVALAGAVHVVSIGPKPDHLGKFLAVEDLQGCAISAMAHKYEPCYNGQGVFKRWHYS